jgi:HAD superfamily hydrolase (TIGR01549 family)
MDVRSELNGPISSLNIRSMRALLLNKGFAESVSTDSSLSEQQCVTRDPKCRFRAWLVDLDGTLYDQRWVRLAMGAELLAGHWTVIPTLRAFRRAQEEMRQEARLGNDCPYHQQIQRAAKHCGTTEEHVRSIVELWMVHKPLKWLRLFRRRQLIAQIEDFRRHGGRTALVSDYPASKKLAALCADSIFEVVIANGEGSSAYRLKPDPDGFLSAASRLGVPPEECLILGDRDDTDGEAARRANIPFQIVL